MADNITLNTGSGGAVLAADDVSGTWYQEIKLVDGTKEGTTPIASGNGVHGNALRVTLASDSTGVITVNLGATDNAVLDSIATAVELIDNAISGTEMQVDVVAALPAGTNAIGKLAANSGVDIGDVDVISVVPGTGATNLGKAEDAVHTTGDTGVMSLAVRNDVLAALAGTDGDYAPFQVNASGALFIQEGAAMDVSAATVTVDNAGTFATQATLQAGTAEFGKLAAGTALIGKVSIDQVTANANEVVTKTGSLVGLEAGTNGIGKLTANSGVDIGDVDVTSVVPGTGATNLGKAEDAVHTTGDVGVMALGVRNDTLAALASTDGDYAPFQVNASGALFVDGSGVTQPVSGTVTANLSATDNAVLDTIDAVLDTINAKLVTGTVIGDVNLGATDNAVIDTIATNTTGLNGCVSGSELQVDIAGASALNGGLIVTGDEAHDSVDDGRPIKIGFKAKAFDGTPAGTDVAEDDRVNSIGTVDGRQFVEITHPNYWDASVDYAAAQTNATVKAAPGAGLKLYITDVIVSNGATAGNITLLDGSGGTVKLELYPAINGGLTHSFRTPLALTANTLLAITSTTVTTHSVTVSGFTAA